MGIIFSENIIIQFFDNQKIYKPKIRKIKNYDGPNDFSILWNQLLILLNNKIIIDSNSLQNLNESFIQIYSDKIIQEINKILYKFLYTDQTNISLYYDKYKLKKNKQFIQNLFQLKLNILNL